MVVRTAYVRYYGENHDTADMRARFYIENSTNETLYAKISVPDPGIFSINELTVTLNPLQKIPVELPISTAASNITETTKYSMSMKVEYYTDSSLATKKMEQTMPLEVYAYIQNSDGTWTSSNYSDSAIIYDYFDFSSLTDFENPVSPERKALLGANGRVSIYPYTWENGWDRIEWRAYPDEKSLFIHLWDDCRTHLEFRNTSGKVIAYKVSVEEGSRNDLDWHDVATKRFPESYLFRVFGVDLPDGIGTTTKIVLLPENLIGYHILKAKYGRGNDVYVSLRDIFVFNPL